MGRPSKNTQMDKNKEKIDVSESPTPIKKTFIFLSLFFVMCPKCVYVLLLFKSRLLSKKFD